MGLASKNRRINPWKSESNRRAELTFSNTIIDLLAARDKIHKVAAFPLVTNILLYWAGKKPCRNGGPFFLVSAWWEKEQGRNNCLNLAEGKYTTKRLIRSRQK